MKVVSLFSGVGGFDLGFIRAGHDVIWANDIWKDATETYKMNIGNHVLCADLKDIPSDRIPDCDIVIGGFPCQGFSVANTKRHTGDERNKLYLEFVRVVKDKAPKYFVAENVKGILSIEKGEVFKMIIKDFSEIGYNVQYATLNAANYGVPQSRERVIIIGIREDLPNTINFPPSPTHAKKNGIPLFGLETWVGVGEALKNIPEPDSCHNLKNHEASTYKLTFNGYLGHREINPNLPCPTITSRGDEKGGVVVHHHPNNRRRISPREAAIIQAFDLDFEFYGRKTSNYRQISNAVPPKLAEVIARIIPIN
jgi:DNA (cytosine-5)-methyltransferase 1